MKFFLAILVFVALVTISMAGPLNRGNQHAERQFAISPAPPAGGPRPPPPSTDGPYPPPVYDGEQDFFTPEYRRLIDILQNAKFNYSLELGFQYDKVELSLLAN
uniref:Uncharacterized protein n=1 Tax=Daphnia galeata TaxID=27404 RepID=A0A8J2WQ76_9CRUS|nr:unnamed protein product [Daphnia galeata]